MKQVTQEFKTSEKITQERIEEVLRIKKESQLTADNLIKAAKKKSNPLHDLFQWDDTEAAKQWRLQQARVFINEIKIVIEEKEYSAFENVSITVDSQEPQRVYAERVEILNDAQLRSQILKKAFNYIKYWEQQYHDYEEFTPIFRAIREIEQKTKMEVEN